MAGWIGSIRAVIALCLTWSSAVSCAAESGPAASNPLQGAWTWIASTGGIAGIRATPETEGYGVFFYFHRNGTLDVYRDGTLHQTASYAVGQDPAPEDARAAPVISYGVPVAIFVFAPRMERHIPRRLHQDTLVLIDPCCDRFEHTFARIP